MGVLDILKKPVVAALLGAALGLAIGLLVGWLLWPVQWIDAAPSSLRADFQADYLRMVIDIYRVDHNEAFAIQHYQYLGSGGPAAIQNIMENPGSQDMAAIGAFASLVQTATPVPTPTGGPNGGNTSTGRSVLIIVVILVLVGLVGFGIFRYLLPLFRNSRGAAPSAASRARDLSNQTELTDYAAMGEEPPIAQFVTTYVLGDDLFDDSFSIDAPSGEFLGECGIGISETIGVGDPKKVSAFEIWLFDKNDIQTITKVLMSPHAFNDVATHQRLQAKGEPFMAGGGKQVVLETAALQLVASISDMEFGQGALPPDSYFDRLTLEIAVWPKVVAPA